jgi:serine/threonine protein kinase
VREAWDRGLRPGATVGRFELGAELGRGGFGIVFEARDRELGRAVAFKAIRPSDRDRTPDHERLLRGEAEAIAQLQHPNIVTLFDAGRSESGPYLILELLRGETLARRLERGPLSADDAVRIGGDIARALAHAHARGVLHRDLKPSNVFLCEDGAAKVLDFGLAHVFGAGGPMGSGTPGWMAPEQVLVERQDERTDVFGLGLLLRALGAAIPPPGAPPAFAALAAHALEPDPARRPDDAAAVLGELDRLDRALRRPRRRRRVAVGILAAAALAAAGGWLAGGRAPRPPEEAAASRAKGGAPGAGALSADVEAARDHFLGESCAARPVYGQDCGVHFRRAVARDPGFAVAHYHRSVWAYWFAGASGEARAGIAAAVANVERAPEKERQLIRAWAAWLDGREDEAIAGYARAAERWPEDAHAAYQVADLLRHRDALAEARPWLERALTVDPEHGWALGDLVEVLGATGAHDALRVRVRAWEEAPRPATLHALSLAYGWLGEADGAAETARRAASLGGGLPAREDLLAAEVFAGRYAEAAQAFRALAAPGSEVRPVAYQALAALEAYQGRRRAGLAVLDALAVERPDLAAEPRHLAIRIDYLTGAGALEPVRADVLRLRAADPRAAAEYAAAVAWLGDAELGASLARDLAPESPLARTHAAIARWKAGDAEGALAALRALCETAPVSTWRVAPLYLFGELAAAEGRDAEAIAALERFQAMYLPRLMWRSWALPRSQVLAARAHLRRGDPERARAHLDRFFAARPDPEPGDPLDAEARALRATLRSAGAR